MKQENKTARIGESFSIELEKIKDARLERKVDKKRKSIKKLTNLIIKHKNWPKIKEDLIEVKLE